MHSKITFLGTGNRALARRSSGGFILNTKKTQIHIDPGVGAILRAQQYLVNMQANNAIAISHNHLNHCNDANALISIMTDRGQRQSGIVIGNETFINGSEDQEPYLGKWHKTYLERIVVLREGQSTTVNDIEVHALPAKHTDVNSIGLKFILPDAVVVYSGDTTYFDGLAEAYKGADILILNTVMPGKSYSKNNLNVDDTIKILKEVNPKLCIITHFDPRMNDPLSEARDINKATTVQTLAVTDGMSILLSAYASRQKQQTLGSF